MKPATPLLLAAVLALAAISGPTAAQPTDALAAGAGDPVAVAPLATLDAFSIGYGETGLGRDLWRGASPGLMRAVLPRLSQRTLSPAARDLAVRLLSTGAAAPDGAGADLDLAAARAEALLALDQPEAVAVILNHATNMDHSAALSHAAAEAFLSVGQDERACEVARALAVGRDAAYWLRLRAYCQAAAGDVEAASLTFALAQQAAPDGVYARLMGVVLAGAGSPGAPSYRNGLEMALSRRLGLQPRPEPALADVAPREVIAGLAPLLEAAAGGDRAPFDAEFDAVAAAATPAARARAQGRVLLLAALGQNLTDAQSAALAGFDAGRTSGAAGARLALQEAAADGRRGQAGIAALALCAAAPATGLALADRIEIIAALRRVGLVADARAFAVEGLAPPAAR